MAPKLILSHNDAVVDEIPLAKESMIIGRRPESDICIDNLAVSGRHAQVLMVAADAFLEDLGSTNGTYVNGKKVDKHALQHGDVITIGKHSMEYVADGAGDAAGDDKSFAETIVISPNDTQALRQLASQVAEATGEDSPGGSGVSSNVGQARLRLVTAAGDGKEMVLTKALTTLGRPGVQVAAVSRRQNGDFIVHIDGGENNAKRPVVNGEVIGVKSQLLNHQDTIEIAGVTMQYLRD